MESSSANSREGSVGRFRGLGLDGLLLLAVVGTLPMLAVFCLDFWIRTDFWFFPLLLVVPVVLAAWFGLRQRTVLSEPATAEKTGTETVGMVKPALSTRDARRHLLAAVLWLIGGVFAVLAAWLVSPWLGVLSLLLASIGWLLLRSVQPWERLVGWTMPVWVLLLFPLSDAADWTRHFQSSVVYSASSLLDLSSIPQMPSHDALDLKTARVPIVPVFRGLGSPYLLLSLAVLLCMWVRTSFLIGLLTAVTVPAWAWLAGLLNVTLSSVLLEKYDVFVFSGARQLAIQGVMLALMLLAIWLTIVALKGLLSPFIAESAGVGAMHRFYNATVLWPRRDPLRKRRSGESGGLKNSPQPSSSHLRVTSLLAVAAVGFVVAGVLGCRQILSGPALAATLTQSVNIEQVLSRLTKESFKQSGETSGGDNDDQNEFRGMPIIAFENSQSLVARQSGRYAYHWTFLQGKERLELSLRLPQRGRYPAEVDFASDVREILYPVESMTVPVADSPLREISEVATKDPLFGKSYLAYGEFSIDGSVIDNLGAVARDAGSPVEGAVEGIADGSTRRVQRARAASTWTQLADSLRLQPSLASLRLFVEGAGEISEQKREEYREFLAAAARKLQDSLTVVRE